MKRTEWTGEPEDEVQGQFVPFQAKLEQAGSLLLAIADHFPTTRSSSKTSAAKKISVAMAWP